MVSAALVLVLVDEAFDATVGSGGEGDEVTDTGRGGERAGGEKMGEGEEEGEGGEDSRRGEGGGGEGGGEGEGCAGGALEQSVHSSALHLPPTRMHFLKHPGYHALL